MSVKVTELMHGAHLYFRSDTLQNGLKLWVVWRDGNTEEVVGEHWEKLFFWPDDARSLCEERGFKLYSTYAEAREALS